MLSDSFRLPSDLHKLSEAPIYSTLEDLTKELLLENNLIKKSYLNSLTAYDYIEKVHICPVRDTLLRLAEKTHTRLSYPQVTDSASYVAY